MANPNRPTLTIRTPGAPTVPPPDDGLGETDADALAADTSDVALPETKAAGKEQTVTLSVSELQAMIAAQVQQGLRSAGVRRPAEPERLPDQRDIDPTKIDKMVLTQQGYVVPSKMGAVPAHIAQQMLAGSMPGRMVG